MAISNYSGIRSLLFEYSNNIRSPKSDRIEYRIPLFGTQLFEYSNNSNYSFKHCCQAPGQVNGQDSAQYFKHYNQILKKKSLKTESTVLLLNQIDFSEVTT